VTIPAVEARPAATALLVSDSDRGIEVRMLRRVPRGFFGGLTAFPGGAGDSDVDGAIDSGSGAAGRSLIQSERMVGGSVVPIQIPMADR